jgi:HEAT repeat protein
MRDELILAVQRGDWATLIEAAENPETVALLQGVVLGSRDEVIRQLVTGALGALAEVGTPGAVDALITVVTTLKKSSARDIAAFYLVGCGDSQAARTLRAALGDMNHAAHLPVVRALAEVGDPAAIEPLVAAINYSRLATRHELVRVLGEFDDVRVVFPLLRLLHHDDERVQAAAHQALSTFAEKNAYGMLIEYLTHQDYMSRRQAAIALGEIGSPRAIKPLIRVAEVEKDERVHQAMNDALLKLGYEVEPQAG